MKLRTPALAIYLMAGDGLPEAAAAAVEAGATAIEVGIPFSDPLADGPTIQRAAEAALAAGMTPPRCLEAIAATHERLGGEVPLIPMTYAAIVERYGIPRFCADAASAGATGLIVADVPPDDNDELAGRKRAQRHRPRAARRADERGRAPRPRLPRAATASSTWSRRSARPALATSSTSSACAVFSLACARTRGRCRCCAASASSRPGHVRDLRAAGADGVIVGSAAISALEAGGVAGLRELVSSLAGAL